MGFLVACVSVCILDFLLSNKLQNVQGPLDCHSFPLGNGTFSNNENDHHGHGLLYAQLRIGCWGLASSQKPTTKLHVGQMSTPLTVPCVRSSEKLPAWFWGKVF